jgi:hypothetical protein
MASTTVKEGFDTGFLTPAAVRELFATDRRAISFSPSFLALGITLFRVKPDEEEG